MEQEVDHGWATCPITQNGVLRIMSQPAYPNHRPVAHGGRFVSFDQRIRVDLVPDASQAHFTIIELPSGQPGG
jgi:hypothetical protein